MRAQRPLVKKNKGVYFLTNPPRPYAPGYRVAAEPVWWCRVCEEEERLEVGSHDGYNGFGTRRLYCVQCNRDGRTTDPVRKWVLRSRWEVEPEAEPLLDS